MGNHFFHTTTSKNASFKNMQVFSIAVSKQVSVEIDYDKVVEDYKVDVEVVNPENDDEVVNGSIIEMNVDELADSEDDYDIKINLIKDKQEPTDRLNLLCSISGQLKCGTACAGQLCTATCTATCGTIFPRVNTFTCSAVSTSCTTG